MNKKGFTLVELLVAIAILGIITGMSIPLIRGLSHTFENKKFKSYQDAVLNSAKLYNDSYSEDLFGHKEYGCAYVTYSQLEDKDLLKDIDDEAMSCNSESTFVMVIKQGEKYKYFPYIGCGAKENGKAKSVNITLPDEDEAGQMHPEYCTGVLDNNLSVTASVPSGAGKYNAKTRESSISIKSATGINNANDIYYKWSTDKKEFTDPLLTKKTFDIPSVQEQNNSIMSKGFVKATSDEIPTPSKATGKYYLIIKVNSLKDLNGSNWKNPNGTLSKFLSFGPFAIDNEKPTISSLEVKSSKTNYNTATVKVNLIANDNQVGKDLKMCISEENNSCDPTTKYTETSNFKLSKTTFDGSETTVYVAVKDLAGNITRKSIKYKMGIKHTLTYKVTESNAKKCSPTTLSIIHNPGDNTKWGRDGDLCLPTRPGYKFSHWNTRSDGKGDMITKNGKVEKDLTVYAQWTNYKVTIKYSVNGGVLKANSSSQWKYSVKDGIIQRDGSEAHTSIAYGEKIGEYGLLNARNTSNFTVTKENYELPAGKEWKLKGKSKTYDEANENYTAADFCDASTANCTVELELNWKPKKPTCTIVASKSPDGENGWYKSPVTLTLKTTGIVDKKGLNLATATLNNKTSVTINKETSEVTYYGKVENSSGSSTCSAKVKYDKTAPEYDYNCVCRNSSFSEEDYGKLTYFDKKVSEYKPSWAGYIKSGISEGFTYALPIMYYDNLTRCYDQGDNQYYPCAKSLTIWYYDVTYDKPNPDKVNIYTGGRIADMPGSGNPMVADLYDICDDAGNCICKNGCNIRCNSTCTDYKPSPLRK